MADPLYELLQPYLESSSQQSSSSPSSSSSLYSPEISQYLSRLVSLRLSDLTTTEPQSLAQAQHSNLLSLQALSSRSYRTTTTSSDHLGTLGTSLPRISAAVESIRQSIPELDASAVTFASTYSHNRSGNETAGEQSKSAAALLTARRNAALLARQADKAQDILELPSLLRASIAAASASTSTSSTSSSSANYTQALDLFAHIKRLQILYPDSQLVRAVLADAELAMKDMTTNLIASLKGPNLRLAPAIRMIGWLRRVAPELATGTATTSAPATATASAPTTLFSQMGSPSVAPPAQQDEGHFGALFLVARLCTFLSMTEALAPLRDLADQETQARRENVAQNRNGNANANANRNLAGPLRPQHPSRKASGSGGYIPQVAGQQTERYLKRYIEIFREQSFATISMYRNIFSPVEGTGRGTGVAPAPTASAPSSSLPSLDLDLALPPALQTFPLYLVGIFMATLKEYLPNVTDATARESLLMQVLYAANSLGRLGADFSLLIAELYEEDEAESYEAVSPPTVQKGDTAEAPAEESVAAGSNGAVSLEEMSNQGEAARESRPMPEPEWITVVKKHRVQAARLEALAAGQERVVQRQGSMDVAVR
ncbi:hypothetical protein A1O7_07575 [Cladophialophora yegresii CBS 114405]|uniref:Conserved oligomeric Golgi complex subunit 8 n=1 Tax=Cladophialophora yegresii CBS 114405 TaxID=1182544 RepID=W9VNV6_9EURO|nr:uncharacterized protein A1O7_07575 [Cladophialophora yegresii CBS 114405]EXJ57228.1 hypothetical protein A1O7_07575 [Cladophialophora yegresii CBS 114405]